LTKLAFKSPIPYPDGSREARLWESRKNTDEFVKQFGVVRVFDTLTAAQLKSLPLSVKVKLSEKQISNALRRK